MASKHFQQIPLNGPVNTRVVWHQLGAEYTKSLINWVQEDDGSLQVRTKISNLSQTGTAIPNGANSVFFCENTTITNVGGVYAARDTGSSITIHRADDEGSPAWGSAVIDTLASAAYTVPFAAGNNIVLYGNWTFPSNRLRFWNGTTVADASTVAIAGRGLTYYKDRFWTCGTAANPSRLYYSGIADHTSWSLDNYIDVGPNDGGVAEDILPANGGLMIAKSNGLWFLSGRGPSDFALTKIDNGEGNWGRCITVTSYGVVVAGTDEVWLWTGSGPAESISYDFTDYNVSGYPVTCVFTNNELIITSEPGSYVYNMETQKWRTFQSADAAADRIIAVCLGGADLSTIIGVAKPGCNAACDGIQRWITTGINRDKDNANRGITYYFSGGFFKLGDAAHLATLRHIHLRVLQRNTGTGVITVSVYKPNPGYPGADSIASSGIFAETSSGPHKYRIDCDVQGTQYEFALAFSQDIVAGSTDTVIWDILSATAEYDLEEVR
jgi:hypothetical protein